MNSLSKILVESEEVVSFLKKDLQYRSVYQRVLEQEVITQAAEERNLVVTPEEIQAEADRVRLEKRLEKAADTLAWLTEEMITVEDWEVGIRDRLLAQKLAKELFSEEVVRYFAENRLDFDQVVLYEIIVPFERVAQELFYEIEEQEISFYEAAHLYDIDEKRKHQCGFEGKLNRWSLKSDIVAVIFGAQPGQIIGPVKTEQGYHLFLVEEFIPAELTPERSKEIQDMLFKDWLAKELNYMVYNIS